MEDKPKPSGQLYDADRPARSLTAKEQRASVYKDFSDHFWAEMLKKYAMPPFPSYKPLLFMDIMDTTAPKYTWNWTRETMQKPVSIEMIKVEPMQMPKGEIFKLDYQYTYGSSQLRGVKTDMLIVDAPFTIPDISFPTTTIHIPKFKEVDRNVFPHDCPRCKCPAYIGFVKVECSNLECK